MDSGGPSSTAQAVSADAVPDLREQESLLKKEEEEFSRRHSMPTRLLAWTLIVGFLLYLVDGLTRSTVDLSGMVYLIMGIGVMRGSQNALRFTILACAFLAAFELSLIASDLVQRSPLTRNNEWHYVHQPSFWVYGISPPLYVLANCLLGIVALKTRRLPFGISMMRMGAAACGIVFLGLAGFRLWDWHCDRVVEREMTAEIGAARAYVASSPSASAPSGSFTIMANAAFSSLHQIEEIRWWWSSPSCNVIYRRKSGEAGIPVQREGKRYQYTGWLKDSSGNRGQLEVDLVIP
jgi:hypothetical protein